MPNKPTRPGSCAAFACARSRAVVSRWRNPLAADFKSATQRLSEVLAGTAREVDEEDFAVVRESLEIFLLARFNSLGADEILDVVDEAITRLATECRRRGEPVELAGAWLFTVARNLAIDRLRQSREPLGFTVETLEDDAIAALLERGASAAMVEEALKRAVAAGDHVCVRIVVEWLDLANEIAGAPASRDVADRAGYSHTSVNDALKRFRGYLGARE